MKHYFVLALMLGSCTSYQSFVTVNDRTDVPEGAKEIIVKQSISTAIDSLKSNYIAYNIDDWGIETHEILLDEGTRAAYKVYPLDSTGFKVVPYWGYTDKVISQAALWGGSTATASMSHEMTRVIYKKESLRPKRVFDYAIQLFGPGRYN